MEADGDRQSGLGRIAVLNTHLASGEAPPLRHPWHAPTIGSHVVAGGPQDGLSSVPSVTCTGLLPSALTIQRVSFEPSGSDRVKTILSPSGDQSGE